MNIVEYFKNLTAEKKDQEKAVENKKQEIPETRLKTGELQVDPADSLKTAWNNSIYGHGYDYNNFLDDLNKFELTDKICDLIDQSCLNHEVINTAYNIYLNSADTNITIDLELANGNIDEALLIINNEYPLFFQKTNLNQVSKIMSSAIIRHGFYASQFIFFNNDLIAIKNIPSFAVKWRKAQNGWTPVVVGDKEVDVPIAGFVYGGFTLENNSGIFPSSLIKPALKELKNTEFFDKSFSKIIEKSGLFKTLTNSFDLNELLIATEIDSELQKNNPQAKGVQEAISKISKELLTKINTNYKLPVLQSVPGIRYEAIDTYQPPANLTEMKRLLYQSMILALKIPASLMGISLQENQTTVSEVQKQIFKQTVTSIQSAVSGVIEKHLIVFLSSRGFIVNELKIKFSSADLESELEKEQALTIKLQNEITKKQLENNSENNNTIINDTPSNTTDSTEENGDSL
jgi:hypothetical protein